MSTPEDRIILLTKQFQPVGYWVISESNKTPNRWYRFWAWILLGWKWRKA